MTRTCRARIGLLAACVITLFAFTGSIAGAEQRPLWLAVGRVNFVKPLEPLAEKRRGEGFETVISTQTVEKALAAAPRRPDFLLLVGDDEPGSETESWYLPAKRMKLYRWRQAQRETFASDAAWGDLDGDLVPDLPVGRIPARTAAEVKIAVEKILAFERQQPTLSDLQLAVWAGSPEYGAVIDAMATGLLLQMLRTTAPAWASPWVLSGNPRHPLCGWPPDQPALFTRQIRRGGICHVLIGHAGADGFFSMTHGKQRVWYTAASAAAGLAKGPPVPPLVFFSCESGNFTRPRPCMAEEFFFFPGGPVAIIAATTESHPLTNYFSSLCLLRALGGKQKRIGSLWLGAQRKAMKTRDFLVEFALRDVEGKLEKNINVEKLRRDQILMYALLGDPATPLRLPKPLKASVQRTAAGWHWKVERPEGATRLHVGHRPAKPNVAPGKARLGNAEEARAAFEAANAAFAFTTMPSPPGDGPWEGTVDRVGWLRLVATGPGAIYVAVLKLQ